MAFAHGPRVFTRTGVEEEEITPPHVAKTRSFDSLSVAHILQAKLQDPMPSTATAAGAPSNASPLCVSTTSAGFGAGSGGDALPLESPSSPSVSSAAAVLTRVQSKEGMDQAAGFLLSLAAVSSAEHERLGGRGGKNGSSRGGGKVPGSARTPSVGKRARASSEDADGKGGSARRRLKMRTASAANGGHGSLLGQQQQQQQQASRRRPAAAVSAVPTGPPPLLAVTGVSAPVRLLSGASLLQLKLLSAAFKLCPHPTAEQVRAIAQRVSLPEAKLEMWFASRRSLQGWVDATPNLKPSQLAEMFYTRRDEAPPPAPMAPPPVPMAPPPAPMAPPPAPMAPPVPASHAPTPARLEVERGAGTGMAAAAVVVA